MDTRKRLRTFWIFGAIVFFITLILAIVWFVFVDKKRNNDELYCGLTNYSSVLNHSSLVAVKRSSADHRVLVNFAGYIQYMKNNKPDQTNDVQAIICLPLNLQRVSMNQETNGESSLVLSYDCARLTLYLATNSKELVVGSIDVETLRSNGHEKECHILSTPIRVETKNYYSCNVSSQKYPCIARYWRGKDSFVTETIAFLALTTFEFEVDGEPESIKNHYFSKSPSQCEA